MMALGDETLLLGVKTGLGLRVDPDAVNPDEVGQSPPEMEWKLERTAPRKVRTEEEMMWVSKALLIIVPTSYKGFLSKAPFVIPV